MSNLLSIISRSLAAKLVIAIVLLILVGGGISWYALIHTGRENLIREAVKDAASYSDLVRKSVRYDMLTFNREAIQETIDDLGVTKDVKGIRLFDSRGRIYYSSHRKEIGRHVDRSALACRGCHVGQGRPALTLTGRDQWTTYEGGEGYDMLTFVAPVYNEPSCSTAACHVHSPDRRVLGILEADFSLAAVDRNIRTQTVHTTVYAFVLMGAIAALLSLILRKFVLKPVMTLSDAMGTVAEGELGGTVAPTSKDEIGALVRDFNVMTRELKTARERMEKWTETLEHEVARKSDELKRSQDSLIRAEKLAALGRMTADVAHEIRNPLTVIGGFARRLSKDAAGDKERERAQIIVDEVDRLEKILRDVLTFSRNARSRLEKRSLGEIVQDVVRIQTRACGEQAVKVETVLEPDLPPVLIDADQVRQALTNLIANALDAMPTGGVLKVATGSEVFYDVRYVFVSVSDSGSGIDADTLPLIFEPFFTTKEIGRGTGLGLSIANRIMEEHGGFIRAKSGTEGSAFTMYFPRQDEEDAREVRCWEYMHCGRDQDATMKCPACPDFGRICWAVAGTFCRGKVQGTFAQKYEDCGKCAFYQMVKKKRESGG